MLSLTWRRDESELTRGKVAVFDEGGGVLVHRVATLLR